MLLLKKIKTREITKNIKLINAFRNENVSIHTSAFKLHPVRVELDKSLEQKLENEEIKASCFQINFYLKFKVSSYSLIFSQESILALIKCQYQCCPTKFSRRWRKSSAIIHLNNLSMPEKC